MRGIDRPGFGEFRLVLVQLQHIRIGHQIAGGLLDDLFGNPRRRGTPLQRRQERIEIPRSRESRQSERKGNAGEYCAPIHDFRSCHGGVPRRNMWMILVTVSLWGQSPACRFSF